MNLEIELTEKLLGKFHLSVPERNLLTKGKVRLSIIEKIIVEKLKKNGCFPISWKLDMPFVGALLKLEDGGKIKLYHKEEISISNPQLIETLEYQNINKAILAFLKIMFKEDIDGVLIDYSS